MLREEDLEPDVSVFQWYIDVFRELNTTRSSMALTPIPFTAIAEYCRLFEIEEVDEFFYIMRCMDNSYLKAHAKKPKDSGETDGKE